MCFWIRAVNSQTERIHNKLLLFSYQLLNKLNLYVRWKLNNCIFVKSLMAFSIALPFEISSWRFMWYICQYLLLPSGNLTTQWKYSLHFSSKIVLWYWLIAIEITRTPKSFSVRCMSECRSVQSVMLQMIIIWYYRFAGNKLT